MNGPQWEPRRSRWQDLLLGAVLGASVTLVVVVLAGLCGYLSWQQENQQQDTAWVEDLSSPERTGSAGELEGRSVLISVFVDTGDGWTEQNRQRSRDAVTDACEYIEEQAASYGVFAELVHGGEDPALEFEMDWPDQEPVPKGSDCGQYDLFQSWIQQQLPADLEEQYGTDSVGYLFLVPEEGISSTYVHYVEERGRNLEEICVIFLWAQGLYECPAVYAHEILHLFGAADLYESSNDVSEEVTSYIRDTAPQELMYTTYLPDGTVDYGMDRWEISELTAYFLGWQDTAPELERFPELKRAFPGCFSLGENMSWDLFSNRPSF